MRYPAHMPLHIAAPRRSLTRSFLAAALAVGVLVGGAFTALTTTLTAPTANAVSGADFDPGRIISDSVFFDGSALSAPAIQNFLNGQMSNCRAGYTCLKDYRQATGNIAGDRYCNGYSGSGSDSAATIIAKVAQSCSISPKVLLVLLQKEQSLVTDTWPEQIQYDHATGFSCPDTAPCDPQYQGFFYQVYYGARIFQVYGQNPNSFNYHPGQVNSLLYNPNAACGRTSVYIQNQATANLYIYTPYVPNAAALNNLYGTGDSCSSYGNRNLWRIFSDWFGSPITGFDSGDAKSLVKALYQDILGREPEPAGFATWTEALIGRGASPDFVCNGVLNSAEYFLARIRSAYETMLGRQGEAAGVQGWLTGIVNGVANVDDLSLYFASSPEAYLNAGSQPSSWIQYLYEKLLGRSPGSSEVAGWAATLTQLGNTTSGRSQVAYGIYQSQESGQRRLTALYQTYLGRGVDPSGIASWVPLLLARGDQFARMQLVISAEYLQRARTRFPSTP